MTGLPTSAADNVRPIGESAPQPILLQPAERAFLRIRHFAIFFSFFVAVVAPIGVAAWYLYARALDQYASTVGFTVRTEEAMSPMDLFGGFGSVAGTGSPDPDILYEFVQSQELVQALDQKFDLRSIYQGDAKDPVFSFDSSGTIEDLVSYWNRMVRTTYDSGTGLIEVRVLAFTPEDAQKITRAVFAESSRLINQMSDIAREDATRFAKDELDSAVERLRNSRYELAEYRSKTQIVDPTADIAAQMGLIESMKSQLAAAVVEYDVLSKTTVAKDPRIERLALRIDVIEQRIEKERKKFSSNENSETEVDYATLVSDFERLSVDNRFAEENYTAALAAYYTAKADANRQTRYLAAHLQPTLAERAEYPERLKLMMLISAFAILGWSIFVLIYYSIRDRR